MTNYSHVKPLNKNGLSHYSIGEMDQDQRDLIWDSVNERITAKEAMKILGITHSTFTRLRIELYPHSKMRSHKGRWTPEIDLVIRRYMRGEITERQATRVLECHGIDYIKSVVDRATALNREDRKELVKMLVRYAKKFKWTDGQYRILENWYRGRQPLSDAIRDINKPIGQIYAVSEQMHAGSISFERDYKLLQRGQSLVVPDAKKSLYGSSIAMLEAV